MTIKNRTALICLTAAMFAVCAASANAEEKKFEHNDETTIKRTLELNSGKTVSLKLSSGGEEMTGVVGAVGNFTVHIKGLQRREFYDAVVQLDKIDAVVFRAK